MFPKIEKYQRLIANYDATDPHPEIGTILNRTKNAMVAVYDFAVEGGAIGTLKLLDDQGNKAILPPGAIITNVVANVITGVTSLGAATLAFGSGVGGATADLLAATAKAALGVGFVDGIPAGTAATWVGPVTVGLGSQLTVTVAAAALTAGKIYFNIEYVNNSLT